MSRKDYRAIADVIENEMRFAKSDETRQAIANIAREMARVFKADNPRFRFDVFYSACGLTEWGQVK